MDFELDLSQRSELATKGYSASYPQATMLFFWQLLSCWKINNLPSFLQALQLVWWIFLGDVLFVTKQTIWSP